MIELNLTYEESKKILELGYDFKNIATHFASKKGKKLKPSYTSYLNRELFIPLIPKAALEACLPSLRYSHNWCSDEWFGHNLFDLDTGEYSPELICISQKLNSAFEAFLWCHENYPEELKKKFDEVMG
jgi:hypothetical protein